jgi:hypothetical protein
MSTTGWARSTGRDSVPGGGVIWTPDQRPRIFVISTLRELAAERQAVRDAVTSLRLVPVTFELGTRPHPPRNVYRACLGQSRAFVGIYWQSYGRVALGEQISGPEDEHWLSAGMPRPLPTVAIISLVGRERSTPADWRGLWALSPQRR